MMKGRNWTVASKATLNALTSSTMTAMIGSASPVISEPKRLIVSADHSLRKSPWRQSPVRGTRLRIAVLPGLWVERDREPHRLAVRVLARAEVGDELLEPAHEAAGVCTIEPRVDEPLRRDHAARRHLVGGRAQRGGGEERHELVVAALVVAADHVEARDTPVVALGYRPHLSRSHDPDEPRPLEHLQVMTRGTLRDPELGRELRRRGGAVAKQRDDLRAHLVPQGAELRGLGDDDRVERVIVGNRRTFHKRRPYGIRRPF